MPAILLIFIATFLASGCASWITDVSTYSADESEMRLHSATAIFIGHAYGKHGGDDIPYKPLENFLSSNQTPKNIFFLGDLVQRARNLGTFLDYVRSIPDKTFVFVRGNHDGNEFYRYFPAYQQGSIDNYCWVWRDMTVKQVVTEKHVEDMMMCDGKLFVLSHFGFWHEHVDPIAEKALNSTYKARDSFKNHLEKVKEKDLIFVSGDGGAFPDSAAFFRKTIGKHEFYITGMGGGTGVDHVVTWSSNSGMSPVFFDSEGRIIRYRCFKRRAEVRCDARLPTVAGPR